jgi:rod shape-determining protein MreC
MSDEKDEPGEHVIPSGGDRIYPKGYSVGTVIASTPDHDNDPFLVIKIKPAADLNRLEEVLVITEMADNSHSASAGPEPMRAADILSQRLPSVPKVDPNAPKTPGGTKTGVPKTGVPAPKASPTPTKGNPLSAGTEQKPAVSTGQAKPLATGTPAATSTPNKTAEAKKPTSAGQPTATPASTTGAAASLAKPKPTPKKTVTPAVTPDLTQPGAAPTATPKPTATPAATQPANQERPPR